jgi:hypothetical protein
MTGSEKRQQCDMERHEKQFGAQFVISSEAKAQSINLLLLV